MTSDEDRVRPVARRRSHRADAIERVAAALASLGPWSTETVVIEAPETASTCSSPRSQMGSLRRRSARATSGS
jgi:hypothetical protein